jgi:hypothetical protein
MHVEHNGLRTDPVFIFMLGRIGVRHGRSNMAREIGYCIMICLRWRRYQKANPVCTREIHNT